MPILQSRMTALISSARDYKQALEQLSTHIQDLAAQRYSHPNPMELLETIHIAASNYTELMHHPRESYDTLLTEHVHFMRSARRNSRNADAMRERRANPSPNIYYIPPHEARINEQYQEAAPSQSPYKPAPKRADPISELITDESLIPQNIREAAAAFDAKHNRTREINQLAEYQYNSVFKDALKNGASEADAKQAAQDAKDLFIQEQTEDVGF